MSSFFSNLFGGSKNKKVKQNASMVPKSDKKIDNETSNDEEELPVMFRRFSLSKSGRMKERKRKNVTISGEFPVQDDKKKEAEESSCDLPDSDIFDTQGTKITDEY